MPVFDGVFAAAITPRRRGLEEVDLGAMWAQIDFLGAKKLSGIVLMGSTGEFVHFSVEERQRMMPLAVKRSRVPILVNVSHSTLDCAIELGQTALRWGAAGILLMPPYFFRYTQRDIVSFYTQFLKQVGTSVPVLVYNIPIFTTAIEPDTAVELINDGFAGIKDSSGDYGYFEHIQRNVAPDKTVLVGHDAVFARARAAGAAGVVSGVAAAVPELLIALDAAVRSQDAGVTSKLETRLMQFMSHLNALPAPMAIKEAVARRGLKIGDPALPLEGEAAAEAAGFREWFDAWLPEVLRECSSA